MRRFNVQPASRPLLSDRNGVTKVFNYALGGVAPHGVTQRWTYTVPAGKRALMDSVDLHVLRDAAAGAVSKAQAFIFVTPSGGAQTEITRAGIMTNAIGDRNDLPLGSLGYLEPGDTISASTADFSTGGTVEYSIGLKLTEGDA